LLLKLCRCSWSFHLYLAWFSKLSIFCRIANSAMFRAEIQIPLSVGKGNFLF